MRQRPVGTKLNMSESYGFNGILLLFNEVHVVTISPLVVKKLYSTSRQLNQVEVRALMATVSPLPFVCME